MAGLIIRTTYHALVFAMLVGATGCAAVFRKETALVRIESNPVGAEARVDGLTVQQRTPVEFEVARAGSTSVVLRNDGYKDHRATLPKEVNKTWLTLDLLTCLIPVALCIPLIVDVTTGAYLDVPSTYVVEMERGQLSEAGP